MKRLTRSLDKYDCRINGCVAEGWMEEVTGVNVFNFKKPVCENCPFMEYINRLAFFEDIMKEKK